MPLVKVVWMKMIVTQNISRQTDHNVVDYTVDMVKIPLKYLYFCQSYEIMCNNVNTYF